MVDGKRNMVGMSLPDETIERLGEIAARHGWSRSQLVVKLTEFYYRVSDAWEACQVDPEGATDIFDEYGQRVYETVEELQAVVRFRLKTSKKILEGVLASGLIPPGTRVSSEVEPKMRVETEG